LWIHRKGTETIEIIKGDRQCLCETTEDGFEFSSHELQLNEGDTIYIFSDGFADTFDETWSEKLKTAGFKKLLLQIKGQTMSEQHDSLNNFLNYFIGTGKQTDDILVFGVRYVQQP
jgi:serine phosphatase RsbU (regulator of sigma subunit)